MNDTTALLTDHYELTMLQASLADGTAHRRSVFELFARRLPDGRRYGVVAGVNRLLDALEAFRFDEQTIAFLSDRGVVDQATCDWLATYKFSGDIAGYADGEIFSRDRRCWWSSRRSPRPCCWKPCSCRS